MGTLVLFAMAYVVSVVMVRVDAHVWLVSAILLRCQGSGPRFLLALMMATLVLSTALPNMVTVLAMTPLVALVARRLGLDPAARDAVVTTLMLGVIYAANVGGVASLIGSPSNAILILAMRSFEVEHADSLRFFTWLAFGVPLSVAFVVGAWGLLVVGRKGSLRARFEDLSLPPIEARNDLKVGAGYILIVTSVGLGLAAALPMVGQRLGSVGEQVLLGVTFAVLAALAAAIRLPDRRERLIRPADLVSGVPVKGLILAGVAGVVAVVLDHVGALTALATWLSHALPVLDARVVIVGGVFLTVALSEVLSNIGTVMALWPIAAAMLAGDPRSTFLAFLGIGLAGNCAFMSPLATPASGMAFGAISGVSLRAMLRVGLFADVLMAALISASLLTWIPAVLGQ